MRADERMARIVPASLSRTTTVLIAVLVTAIFLGVSSAPAEAKTTKGRFTSCAALSAKYPGGIAKSKKADRRTPGVQKVSQRLYGLNKRLDRDKDGVACERNISRALAPAPAPKPAPAPAPKPAPQPVWRTITQEGWGHTACSRGTLLSGSVKTPVNGWTYVDFYWRIDYRVTQTITDRTSFAANGIRVKTVIANSWTPSNAAVGSQREEFWTPSVRIVCGYWE